MTTIGPTGRDNEAGEASEAAAVALDAADPMTALRDRFLIPTGPDGTDAVYLAGDSLGLQARTVRAAIEAELEAWERLGVDAWFSDERPWFTRDDTLREPMARIVGARPVEIGIMNSLTVNLHLLLTSFFRPMGRRRAILTDGPLFPSDRHALTTHLIARGLDPATDLIVVPPRTGEVVIRTDDLESAIRERADGLALVFLAGINFATGQAHDIARLTTAGHAAGAVVGWDLAHAAGNLELALHDWGVDWAAWCNYKYLNGGPGAVASIFVHERHGRDATIPRLGGWWGLEPGSRLDIDGPFRPVDGAAGWSSSTAPILSLAAVAASLAIFDSIGMPALRARSIALTGYLERRLGDVAVTVVTPGDPAARGAQLSVRVPGAEAVLAGLAERGVVADVRGSDVIRLAPVPLYNTFHDAWRTADALRAVLAPG